VRLRETSCRHQEIRSKDRVWFQETERRFRRSRQRWCPYDAGTTALSNERQDPECFRAMDTNPMVATAATVPRFHKTWDPKTTVA
jgi:hypothetical protein